MPKPIVQTSVLELIRASRLVDEARLLTALARFQEAGGQVDAPTQFLRYLQTEQILTPFQASLLHAGKYRGFFFGSYTLLNLIGKGGMGHVFLAEHRTTKRLVAIKTLNMRLMNDDTAKMRFLREAQTAAALAHPNIVRVFDVETKTSPPYIVMEYIEGISLQAAVAQRGSFSAEWTAFCGSQIAQALQAAWDAKLVHRDIKPANVLIDLSGQCKILDLGIVRIESDASDTMSHAQDIVLGTADYLAPEQALDSHNVDCRADIYGLGSSLYFLLAGHAPFPNGSAQNKLLMKQMQDPPRIDLLRPDVPQELADVIHKMLARKREDRYDTPNAAAIALQAFAHADIEFLHKIFPSHNLQVETVTSLDENTASHLTPYMPIPSVPEISDVGDSTIEQRVIITPRPLTDTPQDFEFDQVTARVPIGDVEAEAELVSLTEVIKLPKVSYRRRLFFLSVLIGLFFAISFAAIYYLLMKRSTEAVTPQTMPLVALTPAIPTNTHPMQKQVLAAAMRNTLLVSKQKIPGTFTTLEGAIEVAKNDTRIEIIDPEWNEPLNLRPGVFYPLDIQIVGNAPSGKPVVWKGAVPSQPVVTVNTRRGLTLENFEFDGVDKLHSGLQIGSGGVRVTNCLFRGFLVSALQLQSTTNEPKPVQIDHCRFVTPVPTKLAIRILATLPNQVTLNPKIHDNRFEGPFNTALDVDGSVQGLEFLRNRLHGCSTGIVFQISSIPKSPVLPVSARIERNTFSNLPAVLRYASAFDPVTSSIVIEANAFDTIRQVAHWTTQTPDTTMHPADKPIFKLGADNAFLDSATMYTAPLGMGKLVKTTLATDPNDDKTFLRILDPGATFGVPPEIAPTK